MRLVMCWTDGMRVGQRTLVIFFFNDTATTEIYTLSLHDALPISPPPSGAAPGSPVRMLSPPSPTTSTKPSRSEEHTSELQSHLNLVCRLLLEKKKHNRILDGKTGVDKHNHQLEIYRHVLYLAIAS